MGNGGGGLNIKWVHSLLLLIFVFFIRRLRSQSNRITDTFSLISQFFYQAVLIKILCRPELLKQAHVNGKKQKNEKRNSKVL
jgi:hypothetical protein